MLSDLYGIWKESGDGVDTGRSDPTGGGCDDAAAAGRDDDCVGSSLAEGVAPITAELRAAIDVDREFMCADGTVVAQTFCVDRDDFHRLCDAIDAVHAQLERDYKVACEVNERQDEQYADMVHKLDRAYEKNSNQRKQLTEVQEALHRRNEGELKARWQKEVDRLERENEDLRRQLESLMCDSRPMTDENMAEHGWVRLPLDADGVPIRVGDVMDSRVDYLFDGKPFTVRALVLCEDGWEAADGRFGNRYEPDSLHHHHAPTVEDVLQKLLEQAVGYSDAHTTVALNAIAEYAKRLTLAGDAE